MITINQSTNKKKIYIYIYITYFVSKSALISSEQIAQPVSGSLPSFLINST